MIVVVISVDRPDSDDEFEEEEEEAVGPIRPIGSHCKSQSHAPGRCYLHEIQATEALRLGCALRPDEELETRSINAIAQLQDENTGIGSWFAPFHESTPKFFGGDPGVCMAGHRDCVGIAQSCLQLRGHKLLLCDAGWSDSAAMVRRYGGEAAGTAEDESGAVPMAASEGVSIPLGGSGVAGSGSLQLTQAQLRLLAEVSDKGSCALLCPGDLGVFHASNYHGASNDIETMSLAVYVAFVNWGGLRRLCAIQNYWAGSDDWVNTGDMMEQQIMERELPGLKAQLQPLRESVKDLSKMGSGDTWLGKACAELGEGAACAAAERVEMLVSVAERELPTAMGRLYVETESELRVEDWELKPRSFAISMASNGDGGESEWETAAARISETAAAGHSEGSGSESSDSDSDSEAELERLMHRQSLLPLGLLLQGDPAVHNTDTLLNPAGGAPGGGPNDAGITAVGALGIPTDASGVGELMELGTLKLLQSRQLDHAYGQFTLAGQLYAASNGGRVAGPLLWNQCVTLCTAVAVQLRRARVTAPYQLGTKGVSDVDGGLVAPRLGPNKPLDHLSTLCESRKHSYSQSRHAI